MKPSSSNMNSPKPFISTLDCFIIRNIFQPSQELNWKKAILSFRESRNLKCHLFWWSRKKKQDFPKLKATVSTNLLTKKMAKKLKRKVKLLPTQMIRTKLKTYLKIMEKQCWHLFRKTTQGFKIVYCLFSKNMVFLYKIYLRQWKDTRNRWTLLTI